jgi:hypothetical protein
MKFYLKSLMKPIESKLKHPGTGCPLTRSSIGNHSQDHTSGVSLKHMSKQSSRNYMQVLVGVTLGEDHWLTEPEPWDFGGHLCKEMLYNMGRSVTSARSFHP